MKNSRIFLLSIFCTISLNQSLQAGWLTQRLPNIFKLPSIETIFTKKFAFGATGLALISLWYNLWKKDTLKLLPYPVSLTLDGQDQTTSTISINQALRMAVSNGDAEKVEILCQAGADINEADWLGTTPLDQAISNENERIIEILCKAGADVNKSGSFGITPLQQASTLNEKIVKILCKAGADVNKALDGITPLHMASANGPEKIIKILCKAGANFKKDNDGNTPLHLATRCNQTKAVIDLIFFYGKQILSVKNNLEETPLDYAQRFDNEVIVELFSNEILLDLVVEKRRKEFLKQEMEENCLGLNPLALLAGREIGRTPLQIKLEQHKHLPEETHKE